MTEKELHKLRRQDLLQLLLAQGREAAQLQARIKDMSEELERLQETNTRFIERMDEKDAQIGKLKNRLDEKDIQAEKFKERLQEKDSQIEKLKRRLDEKDVRIGECRTLIEEYRSGRIFEMGGQVSIAEVGHKLEGIFAAAQKAVDQYLEEIYRKTESQDPDPEDKIGSPKRQGGDGEFRKRIEKPEADCRRELTPKERQIADGNQGNRGTA